MSFFAAHFHELQIKLIEQLYLVGASSLLAVLLGLPMGILIAKLPSIKSLSLNLISAIWTIPSLAALSLLLPVFGIGAKPAIIVLTLYALLPIIKNTLMGLEGVDPELIEAADGLGFTKRQCLFIVELPIATPVILSGIRTAVTISTGIATLAAFIGAGGLGDFINRGLATNNTQLVLLGAIPAALMALFFDFSIGLIEKRYSNGFNFKLKKVVAGIFAILIVGVLITTQLPLETKKADTIRIATKNFTEQIILGELMAQLLESKTSLHIERKFNLGTEKIVQAAMLSGGADIYPEYTGTAYLTILKHDINAMHKNDLYDRIKQEYHQKYHIEWLAPFGFENNQALSIREDTARQLKLNSISDLTRVGKSLRMGAPAEFLERPDAMPGLRKAYDLHFKSIVGLESALMYMAIKTNRIDAIMAFTTDARVKEYHLTMLNDDKGFFPPYQAAPLIREEVLQKHPEVGEALALLAGHLDNNTMQHLNYLVEIQKESPANVAHDFLTQKIL